MRAEGLNLLSPLERGQAQRHIETFAAAGAPMALAEQAALLRHLIALSDAADLARGAGWSTLAAGRVYHQTGAAFGFDRLRAALGSVGAADDYDRQAARQLMEDLLSQQALLTRAVMAASPRDTGLKSDVQARVAVDGWIAERQAAVGAVLGVIERIEASGDAWSFAKLTIVNAAMRQLAATTA